jgi:hypothetical protein
MTPDETSLTAESYVLFLKLETLPEGVYAPLEETWADEGLGTFTCNHVADVTWYLIVAGTARWASALTWELRALVYIQNTTTDSNTIVDHSLRPTLLKQLHYRRNGHDNDCKV